MKLYFTVICCLLFSLFSYAQDATQDSTKTKELFEVVKYNKQSYIGYILKDDGREITMITELLGQLIIPKGDLVSIKKVEESNRIKDGKYFPIMPYAGRYGLTNSALHHEGRSAYITTTLVGTEFRHNINTRLSLGITTTWILAPMLLSGNYSFRKKNSILNFSLSSLVGTGTYLGDFKSYIGVHLLTTTLGNQRNNLSLSVGYGYLKNTMRKKVYTPGEYSYYADISSSGRYQVQQGPVVCLSGKAEISPTVSFILESVFFSYDTETSTIRNAYINAHWENGVYVQSHYANIVSNYTKNMKVIMATPGFRFQLNRNTAFQFSIFGIGTYSNSPDFNAIPMAGFYFKV